MTRPKRSNRSNDADKWLNYFTALVDYRRLQRGVQLFHDDAIQEFEWTSTGYSAIVKGSKSQQYQLNAKIHIISKFPDVHLYDVSCDCPDKARYCKHAVCITLHVILTLDKIITDSLKPAFFDIGFKGERLIKKIEESVRRAPQSIDGLPDLGDHFDTHYHINKPMATIHKHLKLTRSINTKI